MELLENEKQSFNNFLECREHIQKRFNYVICCISTIEFILCFIIIASELIFHVEINTFFRFMSIAKALVITKRAKIDISLTKTK